MTQFERELLRALKDIDKRVVKSGKVIADKLEELSKELQKINETKQE